MRRLMTGFVLALGMALAVGAPMWGEEETPDEHSLVVGEPDPHPHGSHQVITSEENGVRTVYTTFENVTHLSLIHPETDFWLPGSGMRFPPGWRTSTNPPATFVNNPSGSVVATWLSGGNFQTIVFEQPVFEVFLHYASRVTVTLDALDGTGVVIASVSGAVNSPVGAPLNRWDPLTLSVSSEPVAAARVRGGTAGRTGIDDFGYRRRVAVPVPIDIKPGSYPNSVNLGSGGTVPVAILSTPTFDAVTVDPLSIRLAGSYVRLRGNGTAQCSTEDVDRDGLLDLVAHVETEAFELTADDTEAILEGETDDGLLITGRDTVRIVP